MCRSPENTRFRRDKLPKRYGIPAIVLASLIALSRLYVGVHYPSDVLFGMIDGILISMAAVAAVEWIERKRAAAGQ